MKKETFKDRALKKGISSYDFDVLKKVKNKKIVCSIKSVSASGMTRKMDFYALINNELVYINHLISAIAGYKRDKNHCLIVGGCGMDMIFSVLSNFNYAMAPLVTGKDLKTLLDSKECGERVYDTYYINANNYKML